MIDFEYTAEDKGVIEFQNLKGEVVKTYTSYEFYLWVYKEYHEVPEDILEDYIDDNFIKLTSQFYNFKNPSEYKANGHPNQLNSKKL